MNKTSDYNKLGELVSKKEKEVNNQIDNVIQAYQKNLISKSELISSLEIINNSSLKDFYELERKHWAFILKDL